MSNSNEINPNVNINMVNLGFNESIKNLFEKKAEKMKTLDIKLDNETKLKFYGLYKVATVGKISESNKKSVGLFDFTEKYKNQAWEKCSLLSKEDAMIEYIKLYNNITGEKDEDLNVELPTEEKINLDFKDIDIPEDYEGSSFFSSTAKQAKKEINEYLLGVSDNEKLFFSLREKIYNGDVITSDFLKSYAKNNDFDLLTSKDATGQSLLHVAVDGMNFSAVKSLVELGLAEHMVNYVDNFQMTPMHIAANNFDIEIFQLLVSLRPKLELKDSEDKTCIDYLKENDDFDKEILKVMEDVQI